jgi:dolichyl-phosphate beta-glucosyltransferase
MELPAHVTHFSQQYSIVDVNPYLELQSTVAPETSNVYNMAMIVPCYNEEKRIDLDYWANIVNATKDVNWIFVDDGSTDTTSNLLSKISNRVEVKRLQNNFGKAEALRWGFRDAMLQGAEVIGFIDADGSFDRNEVVELCRRFQQKEHWEDHNKTYMAVFMSRSHLLNAASPSVGAVRRKFGKIISKINSLIWSELPNDTQCGFKFFKSDSKLSVSMSTAFSNSWFFEIELLIRIRSLQDTPLIIKEVPLSSIRHVKGSHTGKGNLFNSLKQILNTFIMLISFRLSS